MIPIKLLKEYDKIYVLVSGGFDSTYLYEEIKQMYPEKTYPVNCFTPFESSHTLKMIAKDKNYIQIKPDKEYDYNQILEEAFRMIPKAIELKKEGKYHKKIFRCCYYIKHKAFLNNPMFKEKGTVVVSGIKFGDGRQRRIFLSQMKKGTFKTLPKKEPSYFLRHKGGQLYFYPFRDYTKRELPEGIKNTLKEKYPKIKHSGCNVCPVLVVFDIKKEGKRYEESINYAKRLGVL